LREKASAKYWGISVIIMANTQDLVKLIKSNAHTGGDVTIPLHGILSAFEMYFFKKNIDY
jgi:hypothetical protein